MPSDNAWEGGSAVRQRRYRGGVISALEIMSSSFDSEERTLLHDSSSGSWGSERGSDYQTFLSSGSSRRSSPSNPSMPLWWDVLTWLFGHHPTCKSHAYVWRICGIVAVLVIVLQSLERASLLPSNETDFDEWQWDLNHYNEEEEDHPQDPNVLVIQRSTPTVRRAAEIAARPNRAYARNWGMDFGLHFTAWEQESCQDIVQILSEIEDRQNNQHRASDSEEEVPARRYNAMLFLPPDAIITDLELDVRLLFGNSTESVVAYGKDSGVVLWNLDHNSFKSVLHDLREHVVVQSGRCHSIDRQVKKTPNVSPNAVEELEERDGFVEPRFLKFQIGDAGNQDALAKLNHVADSVCYRYYPKCEVVS